MAEARRGRRIAVLLAAALAAGPAGAGHPEAEAGARHAARVLAGGNAIRARDAAAAAVRADPSYGPAHLVAARAALAAGDGIAAEAEIARARRTGVPVAATHGLMAEAYLLAGSPGRAVAEAAAAPPEDAHAWRMRGRALFALERYDEASAAFDAAVQASGADPAVWVELGRFRLALGDIAGAIAASQRAVMLGPRSVDALLLTGELARAQYGLRAALPWFDRALRLDPDNVDALLLRAATRGDAGETIAMLADTRVVLRILPGNPRAFYLQAVLAARAGRFPLAASLLDRTGGRFDGEWAVMLLHGAIEYQAGNDEQAIDWLQRLVTAMPGNLKARRLLGAALVRKGDAAGAIQVLQPLAGEWISDSYALLLLARANERLGDKVAAARLRARAAQTRPGTGFGPPIDADDLETLRSLAAASPNNSDARIELVEGLIRNGFVQDAVVQALDLQRRYPGAPQAHILTGDALLAAGDPAQAAEAYRRAANISFTEPTALRMIDAYRRAGNPAAAREVLGLYLEQNPQSAPAQLMLANLTIAAGEWRDARAELEDIRLRLGGRDALLMNNLAWCRLHTGDLAAAAGAAARAYRLMPGNAAVAQSYGWMLAVSGRTRARGIDLLERAAALAPDSPTVRWHLARAYAAAGRKPEARAETVAALATPGFAARPAAWALLRKLST